MLESIRWTEMIAALVMGLVLGSLFFSGLWWTVRRLPGARRPLLLYFVSLLLRTGAVMAGFYLLLSRWQWPHLLIALSGFLAARLLLVGWLKPAPTGSSEGPADTPAGARSQQEAAQ